MNTRATKKKDIQSTRPVEQEEVVTMKRKRGRPSKVSKDLRNCYEDKK